MITDRYMDEKKTLKQRLLYSGGVFFALLVVVAVYWFRADLTVINVYNYLLAAVLFCVALVSVTVFQSFRISEDAQKIAEVLARDIVDSTHDLFLELYKASPVPYILISDTGVVSSANLAAIRLFKVGEGGLDGKNIFEYFTGEDPQHIALFPQKLDKGIAVNDEEIRIRCADETERWVMLSIFSYRESQTKRMGFMTLVDITKQKEIDMAKSEFVSLASHQLRTPITAMKWSVELLVEKNQETLSEGEMKYITKIQQNLNRMATLVNDFLSVSKFELGTFSTELAPVDARHAIDAIIDEHMGRAEQRGIAIRKEFGKGDLSIDSDPHLFRMIVGNLLSNAIKYSPEQGSVNLTVQPSPDSITIHVADSGMGIPIDEQELIFTKMFRAANARSEVPDGSGLGLYIVKESVKMLGGSISFVSQLNKGTKFTIVLPKH